MPLAHFPGARWGYDGLSVRPGPVLRAPDDLRGSSSGHRLGLAVILDVVYNHLGPDGNYLAVSPATSRTHTRPTGAPHQLRRGRAPGAGTLRRERPPLDRRVPRRRPASRRHARHHRRGARPFLETLPHRPPSALDRHLYVIGEDDLNLARLVTPQASAASASTRCGPTTSIINCGDASPATGRLLRRLHRSAADIAQTFRRGWFYSGQRSPSAAPRGTDPAGITGSFRGLPSESRPDR